MRALALSVVLLMPLRSAHAQGFEAEIRIDQMQPSSADSTFHRAEAPWDEWHEGIAYAFRLTTDYGLAPLRSTIVGGNPPDETEITPVEHALLGHVGASLSPLYWMNFELNFTFAAFETGDDDGRIQQQSFAAGEPGQGDIRIGAHFRPYTTTAFGFSLGGRFWAPSGSEAAYLAGSDSFPRFEITPAVAGEIDVLLYGCTLGIAPLFFAGRDGDRAAASCAAHFKLAPLVSLGVEPHVAVFSYSTAASAGVDSENAPGLSESDVVVQFEPMATLAFKFDDFFLGVSGGAGLGNAPGTAKARALLTIGWAALGERVVEEKLNDADLDGIADEYDACPNAAGSKDRRGCPDERDEDGDGIVEGDACPDEPGASYEDPEANGCPDRDNDHLADPVDPCPIEPGEATGGCPQFARFQDGDFTIDPPIKFGRRDTKLDETATQTLIEVIRIMRANPKIEQVSVTLGTKRSSQRLTNKRAGAILRVFRKQNFDSSRYEVVLSDELAAGVVTVKIQ